MASGKGWRLGNVITAEEVKAWRDTIAHVYHVKPWQVKLPAWMHPGTIIGKVQMAWSKNQYRRLARHIVDVSKGGGSWWPSGNVPFIGGVSAFLRWDSYKAGSNAGKLSANWLNAHVPGLQGAQHPGSSIADALGLAKGINWILVGGGFLLVILVISFAKGK